MVSGKNEQKIAADNKGGSQERKEKKNRQLLNS